MLEMPLLAWLIGWIIMSHVNCRNAEHFPSPNYLALIRRVYLGAPV